jgi:hypothetical protein
MKLPVQVGGYQIKRDMRSVTKGKKNIYMLFGVIIPWVHTFVETQQTNMCILLYTKFSSIKVILIFPGSSSRALPGKCKALSSNPSTTKNT